MLYIYILYRDIIFIQNDNSTVLICPAFNELADMARCQTKEGLVTLYIGLGAVLVGAAPAQVQGFGGTAEWWKCCCMV